MNANNYFVALIIISILVFFSVMQTLTTSFLERLNEFGAIRAIGVSIQNLIFLLVTEIILFVVISTFVSILISYSGMFLFDNLNLVYQYPGSTDGFQFKLDIRIKDIVFIFFWVLSVSLLASLYPMYKVIKLNIIEVIRYV